MDLQDLFFSPTETTSVVGHQAGSVYNLASVQQPHAVAPGRAAVQQSSQFTYTNIQTRTGSLDDLFDMCMFLLA